MQQLMLEKLSGTSSRLPVHVVPFPELNITGIRDPGSLARRSAVMSSRLVLEDWLGSTRILQELGLPQKFRYELWVLQFRMILKDNCCNGHGI